MIPVRVHGAPELKMSSQQIAATMPAWKTDLVGTDQDRFSQASSAKWGSRGATQDSSPCKPPRGSDVISYHTTCLGHRQAMSEFKVCGKKLTSSCQHGHMVDWIWPRADVLSNNDLQAALLLKWEGQLSLESTMSARKRFSARGANAAQALSWTRISALLIAARSHSLQRHATPHVSAESRMHKLGAYCLCLLSVDEQAGVMG